MRRTPTPKLKPYYRINELVELTDTSRGRVLRLLRRVGIEPRHAGVHRLIFASDIEEKMPELWRSLVVCERARAMARALEARTIRR